KGAIYLINVDVEQDLGLAIRKIIEDPGDQLESVTGRLYDDCALIVADGDVAQIEDCAQHTYQIIDVLRRCRFGEIEGTDRESLILFSVLRRISQNDYLLRRQDHMKGLGDLFHQRHRPREIDCIDIKAHRGAPYAAIQNGSDSIRLPHLIEQSTTVPAKMEFFFCV